MLCPPTDSDASLVPFEPAAVRTLPLLGTTVELALVPQRRQRNGRSTTARAALQRSPAARIVRDEAIWQQDGLVSTPNRYPFAREQRILWMRQPVREPDHAFWLAALEWTARTDGTALLNNVGAAATIARAHAHLLAERQPFLRALPERQLATDLIDVPDGCRLVAKDVPFCLIGVRGPRAGVAEALLLLAEARLTPSWNVVADTDTAWIVPRRLETPSPWFPQALGSAELWGRWCYVDRAPFESATAPDLEQALLEATMPALA